jgi:anti-anti-sigma factor
MMEVFRKDGVTILCTGPSYTGLQYEALQEFGEILLSEVTQAVPPRFVIDMSSTTYVGSSFIELLVRAWKRVKNRNGTMALCAVQPFCHEILHVSRLDTIWPIYATRDEAVGAV